MTPFEIANNIFNGREDLSVLESFSKDYVPFIVNQAVAQHMDTILFANQMNRLSGLPKELQYKFYLYGVSKKKRYGKWAKKTEHASQETLDKIMEYYGVGLERATEYLEILSDEQIKQIEEYTFKGGRK